MSFWESLRWQFGAVATVLSVQELHAVRLYAIECTEAASENRELPLEQVLRLLFRVQLRITNAQAVEHMNAIRAAHAAATDEQRTLLDPLALAVIRMTHAAVLHGRHLSPEAHGQSLEACLHGIAEAESRLPR